MIRILIADDEKAIRQAVRLALLGEPYEVVEAADLASTYDLLTKDLPDLLLLDVHFGAAETCHSLLTRLRDEQITIPILILSGAASAKEAADAIRLGAYDFVEKPVAADRLKVSIRNMLESAAHKAAFQRLTAERNVRTAMIGDSPATRQVQRLIGQFAPRDAKVLITGETGTGKEVAAHAIWAGSSRKHKPFIVVNAAAIPETLIESELFGHRKGAFTGAIANQIGKIQMANGGTLFLDEVGELSLKAQSKLLRFLETGEVQVIGSNQSTHSDVRLIAATSRDLEAERRAGHFREDLYFRLNVAPIPLPPLRDRGRDVVQIFAHFIAAFSERYDEPARLIDHEAEAALLAHAWPGNVRELRNVAERAVLLSKDVITGTLIRQALGGSVSPTPRDASARLPSTLEAVQPLKAFRKQQEAEYISHVLRLAEGSITKAAQILDVDRSHLHQKIRDHGGDGGSNGGSR